MAIQISRILHAGYLFECNNTRIVFDPIFENPFSQNCFAFPAVSFDVESIKQQKFSAVFISHYHDDHCSLESLDLLNRATPVYMYCLFEELFTMLRSMGFLNVYQLTLDNSVSIGSFEIIPRRALDCEVDSLFQVKAAGLNILNVVDSWIDPDTMKKLVGLGPWDLLLWPFQTMREIEILAPRRVQPANCQLPHEWLDQIKELNPRFIVPSSCQFIFESWSWLNYVFFPITYFQFEKEINQILKKSNVIRLNPSDSVLLSGQGYEISNKLSWIKPVGEQNLEYDYRADFQPPHTSEIARHFDKLSDFQRAFVIQYCQTEIIGKYKLLSPSLETYFNKDVHWRLSIYDHEGLNIDFDFHLNANNIELVTKSMEPLAWLTEIPIAKLFAAIVNGEALTSLYIRINDTEFDSFTEKNIAKVDILEDPLIRCLYTGVFGTYQQAQLNRIKGNYL